MGIRIHVLHTGRVCVSKYLPFGGDDCSIIKASGLFGKKSDRLWLPVSSYLIEHPKGLFLIDTGWSRDMSPKGRFDVKAQIKSLGTPMLYATNQGVVGYRHCIDEQLEDMGIAVSDIDAVLLTHLDCDHANGLKQVKDAKNFLVSADEVRFSAKGATNRIRYNKDWWKEVPLAEFEWTGSDGPAEKSYDFLDDGSVVLINIPGHSDGLFAVKITGKDGRYVLLFSDGGYATRSWSEMITSGIAADKEAQKRSLAWIREQSMDERCIESIANHDPDVTPHIIEI